MKKHSDLESLAKKLRKLGPSVVRPDRTTHQSRRAGGGLESMNSQPESNGEADLRATAEAEVFRKVENGDLNNISRSERNMLEAIVEREGRPVSFVLNGKFEDLPDPWLNFNDGPIRQRIEEAIPSIGRVEFISPGGRSTTHLGTGFIVGDGLMMTNRHVAQLFVSGVGSRSGALVLRSGLPSAFDFLRERDSDQRDLSGTLRITGVKMIHPYWDMALLELKDVPRGVKPLKLSTVAPADLLDRQIVVIGYPGRGKDLSPEAVELEEKHFGGIYGVKRIAPGEIDGTDQVESFKKPVEAMKHDSSTLAGNSGSALIDVITGEVLGLHFMGATLVANYAVPLHELARDSRVVDSGANFIGNLQATNVWENWWKETDGAIVSTRPVVIPVSRTRTKPEAPPANQVSARTVGGSVATITIPLSISVSLDKPSAMADPALDSLDLESFQIPIMYDGMDERGGYDPAFMALEDGADVPLPVLTEKGRKALTRQEDGEVELKYHHFSIFMHAKRRLALFTAANIDWRKTSHEVDGRKPSRSQLSGIPEGVMEQWVMDDRIPADHQLPDIFFTRDRQAFDKGHLVRRDDVTWGSSFEDIQMANGDTYFTTNCSPQVKGFNQAAQGEFNWGDLENMVQKHTKAEKVMIFSGPVLSQQDRLFAGITESGPVKIQIPQCFWKIIVAHTDEGLKAFGFMPKQDLSRVDFGLEFALPEDWREHLVSIAEIEENLFGLVKLDWFKKRDAYKD